MRPAGADEPLFAEVLSQYPDVMSEESTVEDGADPHDRDDEPGG